MLDPLEQVWEQQDRYNARVMQRQYRPSAEWMETYILGLISECGQLLEAMRWKKNRLQNIEEFSNNVPQELADITKYVFSMWILMNYNPYEMLEFVLQKGEFLENLYTQEFETELKKDIVLFDLDNILADTQSALASFLELENFNLANLYSSIHLDLAINQRFDEYRMLKNKFESSGGYATIEPLFQPAELFSLLRSQQISIVVWTARPVQTFKRIRNDTFNWLRDNGCTPDLLKFGREERISWAAIQVKNGHNLVMIDDDPGIAIRAKINELSIIIPEKGYNKEVANFTSGNYIDLAEVIMERLNEQRKHRTS